MQTGSRALCFLMALVAVVTELVSTAFGHAEAKPVALSDATVKEVVHNSAVPVADNTAPAREIAGTRAATLQNFSMSPMEMRIIAHAPHLRVIARSDADGRQMASLADANERQLLFAKITRG
jgi:hypothetical protein